MVRQRKSFKQLLELLLRELQENAELMGISLNLVALPERDETGCNWSVAAWRCMGTKGKADAHLRAFVADLRKKYNAVGAVPQLLTKPATRSTAP